MSYKFNPFTGNFDISAAGSTTAPGGTDTQVQFNDGGSFAGDSGLTFNKTTNTLTVGGATVTASAPVLDLSQTWNDAGVTFTGLKFNVTDTASASGSLLMDLQVGGVSKFKVGKEGILTLTNTAKGGIAPDGSYRGTYIFDNIGNACVISVNYTTLRSGAYFGISSDATYPEVAADVRLYRDAANTLAQRNGANAQTFRLYNTYTDASNYERGFFRWNTNVLEIGAEASGSGTQRQLAFPLGTVTADTPLSITQTWNNSGATFTALKLNVTPTAHNVASSLFAIQVDGENRLRMDKFGQLFLLVQAGFGDSGLTVGTSNQSGGSKLTATEGLFFASNSSSVWDVKIRGDAANTLAQRNSTNAQESRVYATYTSATNYQRCGIKTGKVTLSNVSGASVTASSLIPAGAFLIGVTSRVNTALGTSNGTTGYQVGTASDPDLWGAITGTAEGTASGSASYTAPGASGLFTEATNVIVTAVGGNFDATGVIELAIHYLLTEAD